MTVPSPIDDAGLFDVEMPPPVSLADRFTFPPFSILDRRSGDWQDRKRRWLSLGIQSEAGRDERLTFVPSGSLTDYVSKAINETAGGSSIFDPVVCELVYRWFTRPGARVLDPFSGGSVRGVVASTLARWYIGVDIRQEQIDANRAQLHLCSDIAPQWVTGDATLLDDCLDDDDFDLVFSCPPYAHLEVYSDHPRDISTWSYPDFIAGHAKAISDACGRLRDNRYAAWVIGDIRDKRGFYYGLHHAAVQAFTDAGLRVINECVLVDPVGSARLRAGMPFEANRKLALTHQHLLIFVKGDVRKAADWAKS